MCLTHFFKILIHKNYDSSIDNNKVLKGQNIKNEITKLYFKIVQ